MPIGRPDRDLDPRYPLYPTVLHALETAADAAPERPALICEDRAVSYAGYLRGAAGLAQRLLECGAAGGRVVVMMGNSNEMAVAMMGAMAARAQMAPVNPNFTERELRLILGDAEPVAIVSDAAAAGKARALAGELGIAHVLAFGEPGGLTLDDWVDNAGLHLPQPLPSPDDLATLPYTGGTTGLPKGVNHFHRSIAIFFPQFLTMWPMEFDTERVLTVAPMFHIWGFQAAVWVPIYLRATLVIVPRYKPEDVLAAIERHRITVFSGGPAAIYLGLMANERFAATDFSSLRMCLSGGAPCPEHLLREWRAATGCTLLEGWGMSEGAPINSTPVEGPHKLMSVGPTAPLTEVDVVDIETGTKVLGPHARGEIRLRGPQFAQSYRNRPEETAQAFRDGRVYTGDIGYFDEDGYLYLVDRKKEMLIVGGYNVYPREIDELLFNHPDIQEAAVVGAPDAFRGESVKAYVVPRPGSAVTPEDLIAYCEANLVRYKVPREIVFVEALPRTGAGKIAKKLLRERAAAEAASGEREGQ